MTRERAGYLREGMRLRFVPTVGDDPEFEGVITVPTAQGHMAFRLMAVDTRGDTWTHFQWDTHILPCEVKESWLTRTRFHGYLCLFEGTGKNRRREHMEVDFWVLPSETETPA